MVDAPIPYNGPVNTNEFAGIVPENPSFAVPQKSQGKPYPDDAVSIAAAQTVGDAVQVDVRTKPTASLNGTGIHYTLSMPSSEFTVMAEAPVRLLSADANRSRVLITLDLSGSGQAGILLGSLSDLQADGGFLYRATGHQASSPTAPLELDTQSEIYGRLVNYGIVDSTGHVDVTVHLWIESN